MTVPSGKGAMVWKLRNWQGGDPAKQVAQARSLGLSWVTLKFLDGVNRKWENSSVVNQNADLLPDTIDALEKAGIKATGWVYTYGAKWILNNGNWVLGYSNAAAAAEAQAACDAAALYGFDHWDIDAEGEYQKSGATGRAQAYCESMSQHGPTYTQSLCSYRWPKTYQPAFPVDAFAPFVEVWSPQVYFLLDNRPNGGAIQLETSFNQYHGIRVLPFLPIFPTYKSGDWTATGEQIQQFLQKAKDLGCVGAGAYELTMATSEQLAAIRDFQWSTAPPPPPPTDPAAEIHDIAGRLDDIATSLETGG